MYLFFLIFGIVFILTAGIFINYIYEFFPINKITNFIYSTNNNHLFNDISILNIPIVIWGLFERILILYFRFLQTYLYLVQLFI